MWSEDFSFQFDSQPEKIWIDDLDCGAASGSSFDNFKDCGHSGFGNHNCRHDEDVHLQCGNYS